MLAGLGVAATAALAGCGETQVVEVIKEVPVEKIVTQIVEKVVVEEKIVVQEKVVTKIVQAATPKPITGELAYWDWFSPTSSERAKKWFAWLPSELKARNPDLNFKIEHVPFGQVMQKFLAAAAAGNAPDAMHTSVDWGLALHLRGQLEELSPFVKTNPETSLDKFVPVAEQYATFRGEQYAMPWDSPDSRLYWYNRTMFEEAGVDPDWDKVSQWTWDEFLENGKRLTVRDGDDVTRSGYLTTIPNQEILAALMHSQGVGFFNDDFTKLVFVENWAAKKSIEFFQSLLASVSVPLTAERQDRQIFFAEGSAMVTGGNWWISRLREQAPDLDADMAPYPDGGAGPAATTWLNNLTLPKSSKNQDAGWRFIEFYTSKETYRSYLSMWGGSGPRKDIVDVPEFAAAVAAEPLFSRVAQITALGGYDPSFMLWSELSPIYWPHMERIFVEDGDIDKELKAIEDEFNPVLAKFFE